MLEIIIGLLTYIFVIIVMWSIIKRTGDSGIEAILIIIPFINLVIFLRLAFTKWPIEEELEKYKEKYGELKEEKNIQENIFPDNCPFCSAPIVKSMNKCISCNWCPN